LSYAPIYQEKDNYIMLFLSRKKGLKAGFNTSL